MGAYELLYAMRRLAEFAIEQCDRLLAERPNDDRLIKLRRHHAMVAARFHARIERLELRYAPAE
jgi:hypothetical protein